MDRITGLEVFIKVVDCHGFSPAAWQMNVSPAKLSKAIRALETEMGFQLLHRTTRHVELTEKGRAFYPLAKEIVERFDESKNLSLRTFEPAGVINIAVPGVIANFFLYDPLHTFLERYPKVSINLIMYGAASLVSTGEADIAFTSYKIQDPKLHYHLLYQAPRELIASPEYLERHGSPKSIFDLSRHDCLVNSTLHPESIWLFGKQQVRVNARITSSDSQQLIEAALAGLGIIWVSRFFVDCFIKKNRLQIIPICHDEHISTVYLCYPSLPKQDKSRLLAEFLLQHFEAHQLNSV